MRLVIIPIIACFSLFRLAAQTIDINEKLAGFFPFSDCTGLDASANGSSGALDPSVNCDCGVRDQAPVFDGGEDKAFFVGRIADLFTTSNFTVSFYFKPGQPPSGLAGATQMVMSKQDGCTTNNAFWVRYRRQGQTSQSTNVISTGISQNDSLNVTLSAKLPNNRCWYHIVVVREGTRYALYVDGVKRDERNSAVRIDLSNNAGFSVSEPKCALDTTFFGQLDELRFYNRAYSTPEINDLLALHPDEIINADTLLYLGNDLPIQLTPNCATSYIWTPQAGVSDINAPNPTLRPETPTTYVVRMIHPDGCTATDTITVNVIDPDTLDCTRIFIPNAFTPGFSSGRNDRFFISNPFAISEFISFEVFDRWGGRVFNAESVTDSWDGTFAGNPVNTGIFLYRLRYRCKGEEKVLSGTVTLLR